ncbi:Platinum sensitivity protein [Mortierella sp. GBA39]|nr:Platinum sensitivity protein [Mortierella sp. GBA39]
MRVHASSTDDDRVLDSIKPEAEDPVPSLLEVHTELGLKLQEPDGYSDVRNAINDFPQEYYVNGVFSLPADEPGTFSSLPSPSTTNLKEIESILQAMGTDEEDQLSDFIVSECYIDKMVSVLKICEDADLLSSLQTLRAILVHLNESDLLDEKSQYRLIYSQRANFKEVVPFNDVRVVPWIHQVFRLQFIKDITLIRHLEEGPKSLLEFFINRRTIKIIQNLLADRSFLKELFDLLKDTSASLYRRQDVVLFMHQFCSMAKKTGAGGIYRRLFQQGLFSMFEFAFASDCVRVKQAGTDILLMALEDSSGSIRTHIVEQARGKSNKPFFDGVINQFLTENDANLMSQLTEIIRVLVDIDPESADDNGMGMLVGAPFSVMISSRLDPDADQFLDLFYTQYCSTLVAPVLQLTRTSTSLDRPSSARCANICMLMSFLIRQHPTRTKVLLSSSRLMEKICILLGNKEKHLRLMAIKFFRTCLGLEDDYFNRILIKNKVIHGVVSVLQDTNGKNNLLNSVCLEFFSFIRDKNNKMLVSHCATVHKSALEEINYTSIFKTLLALHEGDSSSSSSSGGDAMPGSSLKTLWGSQSRLFPGMRLPLFPGSVNDDKADSGEEAFLSNPATPRLLQDSEPHDVEITNATVVEETSSSTAKPAQSEEVSLVSSVSSSLLSPLPSMELWSEIVFLKAGETRDGGGRQGMEANTEATRLKSELAIGSTDSGAAETGLVTKRKREGEDDPDLGDADTRAQRRVKLDAVFLKAGESRDGSGTQGTEVNSEATRLKSELALSDSGAAETGFVTKRKREDEDDPDLGDADTRAQPRLRLDAVVPETTEQPLAEDQDHGSPVDRRNNLDEQSDTADSNSMTAPSDLSNVLNRDNNITNGLSNNAN